MNELIKYKYRGFYVEASTKLEAMNMIITECEKRSYDVPLIDDLMNQREYQITENKLFKIND